MAKGDLLIIGGKEDKTGDRQILRTFAELCLKRQGPVGILTTATNYPQETWDEYSRLFKELGAEEAVRLDIASRDRADDEETAGLLRELGGVFITGGDQLRLTSLLGGTAIYEALHREWQGGMPIGGTSAGAAIMSRLMIISATKEDDGELTVELGTGFGFLEDVLIDQHFSQRARMHRLMNAIAYNPQVVGIGIDENTAILVQDEGRYFDVIGEHTVTVFDGRKLSYVDVAVPHESAEITVSGITLHLLANGYRFDLKSRELIMNRGRDQDGHPEG